MSNLPQAVWDRTNPTVQRTYPTDRSLPGGDNVLVEPPLLMRLRFLESSIGELELTANELFLRLEPILAEHSSTVHEEPPRPKLSSDQAPTGESHFGHRLALCAESIRTLSLNLSRVQGRLEL